MRIHPLALFFSIIACSPVHALDFSIIEWRGRQAISAVGRIVPGDAERLKSISGSVGILPHGHRVLLLDSPGGSINEAMKISRVIDEAAFHTVVPKGAVCASACGAVLFIAGRYRTIEEGGKLGMHTCYSADTMMPLTDCNKAIAEHALAHGVAYGSVYAFMNYTSPENMIFLSRENAECWGITRYFGESNSNFERSDPCVIESISGKKPQPQSAWRIDFKENGYAAFVRSVKDSELAGQLELFCKERNPGRFFLEVLIPGDTSKIRNAIKMIEFFGLAKTVVFSDVSVTRKDPLLSSVVVAFESQHLVPLTKHANEIRIVMSLHPPYQQPIEITTFLGGSRRISFSRPTIASVDDACVIHSH